MLGYPYLWQLPNSLTIVKEIMLLTGYAYWSQVFNSNPVRLEVLLTSEVCLAKEVIALRIGAIRGSRVDFKSDAIIQGTLPSGA